MKERCPGDYVLDWELEQPDPRWASHLAGCDRCAARIEELRAASAIFDRQIYPTTLPKVRARRRPERSLWWWLAPVPLAAAVGLLVLLPTTPPDMSVATRGSGLGFSVLAAMPDGIRALANDTEVPANAALRFNVKPAAPCWLAVVSVDGTGEVSKLFPAGSDSEFVKDPGPLHDGAMLDGVPGPERIFALCSPKPIALDSVRAAARTNALSTQQAVRQTREMRGLDSDVVQSTLLLEKHR